MNLSLMGRGVALDFPNAELGRLRASCLHRSTAQRCGKYSGGPPFARDDRDAHQTLPEHRHPALRHELYAARSLGRETSTFSPHDLALARIADFSGVGILRCGRRQLRPAHARCRGRIHRAGASCPSRARVLRASGRDEVLERYPVSGMTSAILSLPRRAPGAIRWHWRHFTEFPSWLSDRRSTIEEAVAQPSPTDRLGSGVGD